MIKPSLVVFSTLFATQTAFAGKPVTAPVDGWTGPFPTLPAAAGVQDLGELLPMPDLPDPLMSPVKTAAEWKDRFPIDEVHATMRGHAYRLVIHTAKGWFYSPELGGDEGRCFVESASLYGNRVAIGYGCSVGGANASNSADKMFSLYCGVDETGRPGCGGVVISAHNLVHRGSKEAGTDLVHDTISCKPSFHDDLITLEAVDPADDEAGPFAHELVPCVPETKLALSAHAYSTRGAKSRRFDALGRFR